MSARPAGSRKAYLAVAEAVRSIPECVPLLRFAMQHCLVLGWDRRHFLTHTHKKTMDASQMSNDCIGRCRGGRTSCGSMGGCFCARATEPDGFVPTCRKFCLCGGAFGSALPLAFPSGEMPRRCGDGGMRLVLCVPAVMALTLISTPPPPQTTAAAAVLEIGTRRTWVVHLQQPMRLSVISTTQCRHGALI